LPQWLEYVRKSGDSKTVQPFPADQMGISVVVPAYNEAGRISSVLSPVVASELVNDVIVVGDGSDDGTADEARLFPVRVVELPENCGKSAALDHGVSSSQE